MVTIKDGCGCDPCDCDWKQKLKEAYSRAIQSVNKIGDNDGSVYFPDGTGFVKLPLPRQSDVAQIKTNTQDIANLKVRDTQLQADITAETTAREEAISAEASAREAGITAETTAREEAISAEASAREAGITAEASARQAKDTELDAAIARIDNTDAGQDQRIRDNTDKITSTYNDLVSTEATVATHNTQIINLQSQTEALSKSLVSNVMMNDGTTAGSVQVSIEREDGAVVTSANYKWGRDIGVRLEAGTQAGYIKTVISLSDGTVLESNEYKIVEVLESDVYVTAITLVPDMAAGTIGGNISYSNGTTQTINTINVPTAPGVTSAIEALQSRMTSVEQKNTAQDSQISALDARVQAIEDTPGISQFASGKLGTIAGSTADGRVKAEDDGSGSVNGWNALKQRVTTAEGQIVTAQGDISSLNERVGTHDTEISGIISDITAIETKNTQQDTAISAINTKNTEQDTAINGKVSIAQGSANAGKALVVGSDGNVAPGEISSGDVWEEIDLKNFPTDWAVGDRVKISLFSVARSSDAPSSWTGTVPSLVVSINKTSTLPTMEFILRESATATYSPCGCGCNRSMVMITGINVHPYSHWNSSIFTMIDINPFMFNGAGIQETEVEVTRENLTAYVNKIWRLKK